MNILVTGGAGFIGSNFIRTLLRDNTINIINLDILTYSANKQNIDDFNDFQNYKFYEGDISNLDLVIKILTQFNIDKIVNFAAETHVDRSISDPSHFINTNIVGVYKLLEAALQYWNDICLHPDSFKFLHMSTDEVYGSLTSDGLPFRENDKFSPNSPYSASKASAEHIVMSFYMTYQLPILITNCSNNYGPYQSVDKLIPMIINNALSNKVIPIYGNGSNVRDWIFVDDNNEALFKILEKGKIGEKYNIGSCQEKTNIEVVNIVCDILDQLKPNKNDFSYKNQIEFVEDRKGHDFRYAIDNTKICKNLDFKVNTMFNDGILETVKWYLSNLDWMHESNINVGKN